MKRQRLHCKGSRGCVGMMKTETAKRISYECKIPLQKWEGTDG